MQVKIGKLIISKAVDDILEIYKITGVGFDRGITTSEPMIEIALVKEVRLKKKEPTILGLNTLEYVSWRGMNHQLGLGKYSSKELVNNFRDITPAEQVLYGV